MKTMMFLSVITLLTTNLICGKDSNPLIYRHYYIGGYHTCSGNGYGAAYTFNAGIQSGRKSLEAGLLYSERDQRISGGDFKYRIYLGNINKIENNIKVFSPYLQYNLIYQIGISHEPDVIILGDETYEVATAPGRVASMGHYVQAGNKLRLFNRVYFDTSIGLGVYQGSLSKTERTDTWGIHYQNHGFTFACKVGLTFILR